MSDDGRLSVERASELTERLVDSVGSAVVVDDEFLETVLTGVLARGHVLLEDVPGTGKTLTAVTLADALGLEFSRVQFTPDLLPGDITGSYVYDEDAGDFRFAEGPVFANVVLADEINRAPPKTQAALLEAMEEEQVTVDGRTHDLPSPFFVVATQNPVEHEGTFELPEAQRDRFALKTSIGYPDEAGELELIDRRSDRETQAPSVDRAVDPQDVRALRRVAERVTVEREVRQYIVKLARATRDDRRVEVGISPRGVQRFYEVARARAVVEGRDFVVPDDVKRVAEPVMQHRIVLSTEARVDGATGADVVADVLDAVEVPAAAP